MPLSDSAPISIHTLLAESDLIPLLLFFQIFQFQSTPSSRRVTGCRKRKKHITRKFQSTPSSRRVTNRYNFRIVKGGFQSTPSSRRVTLSWKGWKSQYNISIHTLLAESDPTADCSGTDIRNFNPHPPRGE